MNINISTTQWGDNRQLARLRSVGRRSSVISRNLIMALSTITLAGLMVIQAAKPADFDKQPVDNPRSTEVIGAEHFFLHSGIELR